MRAIARWTIGHTTEDGYECLQLSVESVTSLYDVQVVICHNCPANKLPSSLKQYPLIDQHQYADSGPAPKGVAWKLYPPRLASDYHELVIDNDIILKESIPQIEQFLNGNLTLLLEGDSRTYGRFEKHVPPGFQINSGIYGMPPGFDLNRFVQFYAGQAWEKNALYENDKSETFDEQGLVAVALLSHPQFVIIPAKSVTNCEHNLVDGLGHHFIGLNRRRFHAPYRLYKTSKYKLFL